MGLESVEVRNIGPIKELDVEFSSNLTVVTGPNGSGKSSLLEGIRWCVCGESLRCDGKRVVQDSIIRLGAEEGSVILRVDGATIERRRSRGGSTRLRVVMDEEVLTGAAAQARVWDILGTDPDAYSEVTHVSQGRVTALADASDQERRDILLSWLGSSIDAWEQGRLDLAARRKRLRGELRDAKTRLNLLTESLSSMDEPGPLPDLDALEAEVETARKADAAYRRSRDEWIRAVGRRDQIERELQGLDVPDESLVPVPDELPWSRDDDAEIAIISSRRSPLLRIVAGDWEGTCPVTRDECPAATEVRSRRNSAAAQLVTIDTSLAELEARRSQARNRLVKIRDAERRNESVTRDAALRAETRRRLKDELTNLRIGDEPVPPAPGLDEIRDRLDQGRTDHRIRGEWVATRARVDELKRCITTLEDELGIMSAVIRAADDIAGPALVAGARVEERTAALLQGTGLSVRLSWSIATGKRVTICPTCDEPTRTNRATCAGCGEIRPLATKPDLGIIVSDGRTERDVRFASGGQRQVVCLAMRLATCPTPFLILDEIDSALDPEMSARVARLLRDAATTGLQVIVVSHSPAVAEVGHTIVEMD